VTSSMASGQFVSGKCDLVRVVASARIVTVVEVAHEAG